jgi:hypothetical protein
LAATERPLLQSHKLQPGEQAFILMSLVPNRKGQPLLVEWQVATVLAKRAHFALEPLTVFAKRAGLQAGKLPNRGQVPGTGAHASACSTALPMRCRHARSHAESRRFRRPAARAPARHAGELQRLQASQFSS